MLVMATGPSNATRRIVYRRSHNRCEMCTVQVSSGHIHHRKPRRMGGRKKNKYINEPENLLLLCEKCHMTVESNRKTAVDNGFLLRESDDPAVSPVFVGSRRWVLLSGESYLPAPAGSYSEVV